LRADRSSRFHALQLKADGHDVYLCSHPEYKDWVAEYGLELRPIGGDPGALMKVSRLWHGCILCTLLTLHVLAALGRE
jgi:UDP:flavonoid glycosyltransferase YjiC (YdhE family)